MPERTYLLLTVGIIALIFIVSMTIPFASILIGAVLLRHARWKEIVLVSSLGSATGGNRRLVLALKSGWSIRKRWRSSWRKATGLSSSPSPPKAIEFAQRWGRRIRNYIALDSKVLGILPRIREDRSTLPIESQSFVSSGDGVFIPAFSFPGFGSIPGVILAKHRPKFPTALRGLLAKPLLKQDR
ncbi:hypothetical protein V1286_006075 [Bradyrhizobium algeriense]|uniref:Uncharacterized protein n=1 Tax=Bradyrhizobium algeriense TaxID=634784 RepID=A0ABU8BKE6_9BRAD